MLMKTFLLTLSYQQRRLSCPHIQILVEQLSLHTQYCNTRLDSAFHNVTKNPLPDKKVTDLHVSNVPVDVHGGRNAVFRDVFVTLWIRFTVHRVNTGDGNSFMTKGYVTVNTQDDI